MKPSYNETRPVAVCDTEVFPNYWSIGFQCVETKRRKVIEMHPGKPLDRPAIANVLRKWTIVGFNLIKYDIPMIMLAMRPGVTNEELKRASDELIMTGIPHWKWMQRNDLEVPAFIDAIDLMEVNPGAAQKPSLKICGGRLHSKRMQDLPFEHSRELTSDDMAVLRSYHGNDLELTEDMWFELKPQINLRVQMSKQYGVDLRSKSDAQIAEAVIKAEIERVTRQRIYKPEIRPGLFYYEPPRWLGFETHEMRQMLHEVRKTPFVVDDGGTVRMPKYLEDKKIAIGSSVYRMGIGGLHSSEESIAFRFDDERVLTGPDVTSYYPNIIIKNRLIPEHLGQPFLDVYERIYERRVAAKRNGDKSTSESLKIVLNGSFGKLGSPYSVLYSPNLMIQTTVTGQLALLMLIERLETHGINVVSANTDGIVNSVPRASLDTYTDILWDWEDRTGFNMEDSKIAAYYARDVNSYIAVDFKGKAKTKGAFATGGPGLPAAMGLKKNPNADICSEAAVAFLSKGTPIEQTINECTDVRKFIVVRRVTGGATDHVQFDEVDDWIQVVGGWVAENDRRVTINYTGKGRPNPRKVLSAIGETIGKAIRWYHCLDSSRALYYIKDGRYVPKSQGAMPIMELPDGNVCPPDLDRDWYIREAYAVLQDVGYGEIDPALRGRTGTFFGLLPGQKTIHRVHAVSGIALCGRRRESIRDKWQELGAVPMGQRLCSKCRKESEL